MFTFKLPDPGEGLLEAEITTWLVKVGDQVNVNDIIVEIETAKSLVELPAPVAGRVHQLLAEEGQTIPIGDPLIIIDDGSGDEPLPAAVSASSVDTESPGQSHEVASSDSASMAQGSQDGAPPMLVGYGPRPRTASRRAARPEDSSVVLAKPPVRKMADDLGIDLAEVEATGPAGVTTRDDVTAHINRSHGRLRDAEVPIRGVRKVTAENVADSLSNHATVTIWSQIDVSATMELLDQLKSRREFRDVKLSPLVLVSRAVCLALARHPELNASWHQDRGVIEYHGDVNLGIAAATGRGLLVPVVQQAQQRDMRELAREISRLVTVARDDALQPSDYSGGTFTITNVGVFGLEAGTPVINGNESAILCLGAINRRPWVVGEGADERLEPRWVTTLALSFDHRLIDGEESSGFLRDVADLLAEPGFAMAY